MKVTRAYQSLVVFAVVLTVGTTTAESVDPDRLAREIGDLHADVGAAARIDEVRLDAGLASVVLLEGVLVPATPVAGRPVELAFTGRGRIELEPPDRLEADQLELFTGSRRLDEGFDSAVLVIARDAAVQELLAGPPADVGSARAAVDVLQDWLGSPERRRLDVEARIWADALDDRLTSDYFCGRFDGDELGRFLYVADPLAEEQITLGRFVRPDLDRRQRQAARRELERAQRRGKLIGLEIADLGTWDTWVSSTLVGDDGRPTPGARGVEPERYELDLRFAGPDLVLDARARLSMSAVADGLRAVALELHPDLEVLRVTDARGRNLAWFRSRNELVAAVPRELSAGGRVELVIEYRGRLIDISSTGATVLRTTTGWHPRAGTVDRATYSVAARWPAGYDLVAPGAVEVLDSPTPDERSLRWRIDRPVIGTSFEIGRFATLTGRAGDVRIDVAVDRLGHREDPELGAVVLATVTDAVEYFESLFGPLPLDRLQVVSSPRGFSQGLHGFVTLSTSAVVDWDVWGAMLGLEDRRTVIAHEVAHQWWGNLVGWRSYRDQWITEAMANHAALAWRRHRLETAAPVRWAPGPTANWQADLLRTTRTGRTVDSLGPLTLGERLDSSVTDRAYAAIVYKKGALVLNTLAHLVGESTFRKAVRRLVSTASGRDISTAELVDLMARSSGRDLSSFERRYIRGTGLPDVDFSTSFERSGGGGWVTVGALRRRQPVVIRHRIVDTSTGALDLRSRAEPDPGVSPADLAVPVRIGLAPEPGSAGKGRRLASGRIVLGPTDSSFRIETDGRPEAIWLDRRNEVFGRFVNADVHPRLAAQRRAADLEAAGDLHAARAGYLEALERPVAVIPDGWRDAFGDADTDVLAMSLDARIRLALARLALDAGETSAAGAQVARARDLIRGRDRWLLDRELLVVESRLALLSGDPRSAYRELKNRVLGDRPVSRPETWALLALAARGVGDEDLFRRARDRARELGVELGPLAVEAVQ